MDKNKIAIAIDVSRFPVRYLNFLDFIERSPELGYINFLGDKIFTDSEELPDILDLCAKHGIDVEISNLANAAPDIVASLVTSGAVVRVVFPHAQEEELKPVVDEIIRLRNEYKLTKPEILCIVENEQQFAALVSKQAKASQTGTKNTKPAPENAAIVPSQKSEKPIERAPVPTSFGFYDLVGDLKNLPCGRLLSYPLLNFDGRFIGCWENYQDTPVNAFKLGIVAAMNHKFVKRMCKMLYTGRPDVDIPCMRCPIYTSLVWANKRVRLVK